MNSGVISSRYASALLKYTESTGSSEVVAEQVGKLLDAIFHVPGFRDVAEDVVSVSLEKRLQLFDTAVGGKMCDELVRFVKLIEKNRRLAYLRFILKGYIGRYYEKYNIVPAEVITATSVQGVEDKFKQLAKLICSKYNSLKEAETEVKLDVKTDPDLIGGFVFSIGDYMLDASAARSLKIVRNEFIEKNRRIV